MKFPTSVSTKQKMHQLPHPILAKILTHLTYTDYINLWQVPTLPLILANKRLQQYLIYEKYGLSHQFSGSFGLIEKILIAPDVYFNSFLHQNKDVLISSFQLKKLRQQRLLEYNFRWPELHRDLYQYFTHGDVTYSLIDRNYLEPVPIQLPLDIDERNLDRIYICLAEHNPDVIYRYLIITNNFDWSFIHPNKAKSRMLDKIFGNWMLGFKYLTHKVKYYRIGIYCYLLNKHCLDYILYFLLAVVIFVFLKSCL